MPSYDNIVDAFPLVQDGVQHTVSLDNQGASLQGNESTFAEAWPTVWMKVDLSTYLNIEYEIPIDLVRTGGNAAFAPYAAVYRVIDASFNPASPDFSKLDYAGELVGNGSTDPPEHIFTLHGGTGLTTFERSITGIYYFAFTDYNYAVEGTATATYTVPALPVCVNAIDVLNPAASSRYDGSSATVTGDGLRVRETWDDYEDFVAAPAVVESWSLKWTWTGPPGSYKVGITGKLATGFGNPNSGAIWALFRINGKQITTQGDSGSSSNSTAEFSWVGFTGETVWANDYHRYPWLPLNTGDVIEVLLISNVSATATPFAFIPFECTKICFFADLAAPVTSYSTSTWDFADHPIGDQWGSPNGWGGQRFVPDQIWTHMGVTPYNESQFPWGIDYTDYDFAALPDGKLYVIIKDGWNHGLSSGHTNPDRKTSEYHYTVIKKYNPSTDTWSQIATININAPTMAMRTDAMSCEVGPDGFVYMAWWEESQYSGTATVLWKWHLIKLNPANDTYVELGTGQNAFTPTGTNGFNRNCSFSTLASSIAFGDSGSVYVATIEDNGHVPGTGDPRSAGVDHKCIVWRWDGSSWSNLNLPDPTDLGVGTYFAVNGENSFYDRPPTIVSARHSVGPVTNGITLHHPYTYMITAPPSFFEAMVGRTISYTHGTGWHNEFVSDWTTKIKTDLFGQTPGSYSPKRDLAFDVDILWHPTLGKLVLVTDFVGTGEGSPWMIWKMNDAGNDWVRIEDAPASIAGPWRQSRNTSAIGLDGNIYRGMISEWNRDVNFYPRVVKHSPGYGVDFSNAVKKELGQETNKPSPANAWMYSTTNYRLRILGSTAYIMCNLYAESADYADDPWFADAIYIFKLSSGGPMMFNKIVPLR